MSRDRRLANIALASAAATLSVFAIAFLQIKQPRPITEVEVTVAKMPLGITASEADQMIGSPPDSIHSTCGALVNPVTMLAESNARFQHYEPQSYSMRVWERDGVKAVVAVDADGQVAGRWTWRPNGI